LNMQHSWNILINETACSNSGRKISDMKIFQLHCYAVHMISLL
jgi:hypothetical protein